MNRLHLEFCHHDEDETMVDTVDAPQANECNNVENAKINKFVTKSEHTEYGFGVQQNYIHLKPRCNSLREELQCNEALTVSSTIFMGILQKAVRVFCGNLKIKPAREYAAKHGILTNDSVTVKHVVSVLSYTDLTKFRLRICFR